MNYFHIIIIVFVLFAFNTVCGANGIGYIAIKIRKNYKNKINGMILDTYTYELNDTLELKCGGLDYLFLEWTDDKNKISQKSCSETKDFKLILEKLREDDNQTIFTCKSQNHSKTVTLELNDNTDLSRTNQDNCYKIVRESHKNCSHKSREEVITRKKERCPTEILELSNYNNDTKNDSDVFQELTNIQKDSGVNPILIYGGVVIFMFISLTIITLCVCKCNNKIKKIINTLPSFLSRSRIKTNEPIYAEPNAVVYAELQMSIDNPPVLPIRNDPPYAEIIGIMTPAPAQAKTK